MRTAVFALACSSTLALASAPACAGDTVLYAKAPDWAAPVDFAAALAKHESLVVLDEQVRMVGGTTATYSDIAYKIDNPEALTKAGTLQLGWLPDKGDLTVHRIEIYRDGVPIDLVAAGSRYTVLRRETALEKRSMDGSLTATLAVPGLKVGDVVRFSQTITLRDQALGDAMQFANPLLSQPVKMGFGRIAVSWPKDQAMVWRAGPAVDQPAPVEAGGFKTLTALLPLPKREDMPKEAPARYGMTPLLQVTSFTGWEQISSKMAPLFSTEKAIAPGSALDKRVAAIAAASSDPKTRMVAALRAVQDDVAYLLNGMNGGNYIPQSPEETWSNRFGDCKAKSLLLTAMLRKLGIEAEPVLVRSNGGDAVASLLPMPSAFDHAIVHATLGGRDYWLDGTDLGVRADTVEEVPPFAYALPLRPQGSGLVPMTQRWPLAKDRTTRVTYDYRAGLDMPVLYDATMELRGRMGAEVHEHVDDKDPQSRLDYAAKLMKDVVGDGTVYATTIAYDPESGVGTVTAKGLLSSGFEFERGRGKLALGLPSTGYEFAPDRAKAAWQAIPYAITGPFGATMDMTVLLPADAGKLELAGLPNYEGEVGGIKVKRTGSLSGQTLHVVDEAAKVPSEIAPADFATQRAAVAKLNAGDPVLRTDTKPTRYWNFDTATARQRIAGLEPAYNAIIAIDPKEGWRWATRAKLFELGPDLKRALADFDKAISLEASADNYSARASLKREMGDLPGALADAREAFKLEATSGYARGVADILAEQGKTAEALAILDGFDLSGDERITLMLARADVMGEGGKRDEGWDLLTQAASERPGDAQVLNAQCWYMGNWSYKLDDAAETCDRAVKAAAYSSGTLDSRALVHYRLGQRQEALSDLQAALTDVPNQTTSLYLRGVMALEDGKREDGERDIAAAMRLYGGIEAYFARFGVKRTK